MFNKNWLICLMKNQKVVNLFNFGKKIKHINRRLIIIYNNRLFYKIIGLNKKITTYSLSIQHFLPLQA